MSVAALLLACGAGPAVDPAAAPPESISEPLDAALSSLDAAGENVLPSAAEVEEEEATDSLPRATGEAAFSESLDAALREAEEALERRLRLERELDEWRGRAEALEDRIRAERDEAEGLRARLATLEDRLRERAGEEGGVASETAKPALSEPPSVAPVRESRDEAAAGDVDESRFPSVGGLFGALWSPSDGEEPVEADPRIAAEEDVARDESGDTDADVAVEAPPALPPAATAPSSPQGQVSIEGRVAKPGRYALDSVRTVNAAVDAAKAAPGADLQAIEVRRPRAGTVWTIVVNLEEVRAGRGPDLLLFQGDEIVVPASE